MKASKTIQNIPSSHGEKKAHELEKKLHSAFALETYESNVPLNVVARKDKIEKKMTQKRNTVQLAMRDLEQSLEKRYTAANKNQKVGEKLKGKRRGSGLDQLREDIRKSGFSNPVKPIEIEDVEVPNHEQVLLKGPIVFDETANVEEMKESREDVGLRWELGLP